MTGGSNAPMKQFKNEKKSNIAYSDISHAGAIPQRSDCCRGGAIG